MNCHSSWSGDSSSSAIFIEHPATCNREAFKSVLGTLVHIFSPPDVQFHLDGAENWNNDSLLVGQTTIDLEPVAMDKIGPYPTISSRSRKVQLVKDYVEGGQQLYRSNSMFNGTTTRSSVPRTTSRERDS